MTAAGPETRLKTSPIRSQRFSIPAPSRLIPSRRIITPRHPSITPIPLRRPSRRITNSHQRLQQKNNPVREQRKTLPLPENPLDPFTALKLFRLPPGKSLTHMQK
jgi:hypothetical protein